MKIKQKNKWIRKNQQCFYTVKKEQHNGTNLGNCSSVHSKCLASSKVQV